jgi:ribonuclease HI
VTNGIRYAGAAVVTLNWTIWAQALGHGTSAQKAELIALTQGLRYGRDKIINVYTDSQYAFETAPVHGALYRERGFLTSVGKHIKNVPETLALLEALWLPKMVAIIHCRGHQKGDHSETRRNRAADQAARTVTTKAVGSLEILLTHTPALTSLPNYIKQDSQLGETLQLTSPSGWQTLPDGRVFLPQSLGHTLVKDIHDTTHLGPTKLTELLRKWFFIQNLEHLA